MGKHIDNDDARTIRAWLEWLGGDQLADVEAAIAAFLAEREKKREAEYSK